MAAPEREVSVITLMVVLLAVAVFCLYRLAKDVEAIRNREAAAPAKQWLPFSTTQLRKQEKRARAANQEASQLTDELIARFGGRTLTDAESLDYHRMTEEATYARAKTAREQRHLNLMIQANARVARGEELLTEAQERIFEEYFDGEMEDLEAHFSRQKEREEPGAPT